MSRRNSFRNDRRSRSLSDVNHLCTRISLLLIVCNSDTEKLPDTVVSFQYTARIFPRYRRTGFYLSPADFCSAMTQTPLCDKIEDPSFAVFVSRIPVLYGTVPYLSFIVRDNFHNSCVEFVFISLRCGAPF